MGSYSGRLKEEGGHRPYKLSFNKVTSEGLEKIRRGGNISKFVEKQLKPIIENLDPGQASVHIWRYEIYLSQQIIRAAQQNKLGEVQALAGIANALKDYRNLCGIPPADFDLTSKPNKLVIIVKEESETDKARAELMRALL